MVSRLGMEMRMCYLLHNKKFNPIEFFRVTIQRQLCALNSLTFVQLFFFLFFVVTTYIYFLICLPHGHAFLSPALGILRIDIRIFLRNLRREESCMKNTSTGLIKLQQSVKKKQLAVRLLVGCRL